MMDKNLIEEILNKESRMDRLENKVDKINERSIRTEQKLDGLINRIDEHTQIDAGRLNAVEDEIKAQIAIRERRVEILKKVSLMATIIGTVFTIVYNMIGG